MAEGVLRHLYGDRYEVFSAGTEATLVKPQAIAVLAERGIDAETHWSKTLDGVPSTTMDIVVTVCDSARETCPFLSGRLATIHHSFPDPSDVGDTPEKNLQAFRDVLGQIESWIREIFGPDGRFTG